ncbi:hypothetical protein INR49_023004 [Caranx melampygus]|nr:hypothetical protein INR49_023004 [Caranx melampygus]
MGSAAVSAAAGTNSVTTSTAGTSSSTGVGSAASGAASAVEAVERECGTNSHDYVLHIITSIRNSPVTLLSIHALHWQALSRRLKKHHAVDFGEVHSLLLTHLPYSPRRVTEITLVTHQEPGVLPALFCPGNQSTEAGRTGDIINKEDGMGVSIVVLHHGLPEALLSCRVPQLELMEEERKWRRKDLRPDSRWSQRLWQLSKPLAEIHPNGGLHSVGELSGAESVCEAGLPHTGVSNHQHFKGPTAVSSEDTLPRELDNSREDSIVATSSSLNCAKRKAQVQELKLQTNEFFMEEGAVPSHNMTLIWIQNLQLLETYLTLCSMVWTFAKQKERSSAVVHGQPSDSLDKLMKTYIGCAPAPHWSTLLFTPLRSVLLTRPHLFPPAERKSRGNV